MAKMIGYLRGYTDGKKVGQGSRTADSMLESSLTNIDSRPGATDPGRTRVETALFHDGSGRIRIHRGRNIVQIVWRDEQGEDDDIQGSTIVEEPFTVEPPKHG